MKASFKNVCRLLAAKNCYESGLAINTIASQAGVPAATVRRWLRTFSKYRNRRLTQVLAEAKEVSV